MTAVEEVLNRPNGPMSGKRFSREHCDRISAALCGKNNPRWGKGDLVSGKNNPMYGRTLSLAHRARISETTKARLMTPQDNPFYEHKHSLEARKKIRQAARELWKDSNFRDKITKARILGLHKSPTKPEILLGTLVQDLYPGNFVYNGDGPTTVGGYVPDFVHNNGRKLAINVNGDYWHKGEDVRKIKRLYAKSGYSLLVIWEKEINSDWDRVIQKIKSFVGV